MRAPSLSELARLDDAAFRSLFSKSPVKRIGRERFVRNVLYAIGNSGEPALAAEATRLLDDPAPVVRGAAVWALGRLLSAEAFAGLRGERQSAEEDGLVREEWLSPAPNAPSVSLREPPPPLRGGGSGRQDAPLRSGGAVSEAD